MISSNHHIKSVFLEISCIDSDLGKELLASASDIFQQKIQPIINHYFDNIAPHKDTIWKIDHLSVELSCNLETWSTGKFTHELMEALDKQMVSASTYSNKSASISTTSKSPKDNLCSEQEDYTEALLIYLKEGHLPWAKSGVFLKEWIQTPDFFQQLSAGGLENLKIHLQKGAARTRLIHLITDAHFTQLLEILRASNGLKTTEGIKESNWALETLLHYLLENKSQKATSSQIATLKKEWKLAASLAIPNQQVMRFFLAQLDQQSQKSLLNQLGSPATVQKIIELWSQKASSMEGVLQEWILSNKPNLSKENPEKDPSYLAMSNVRSKHSAHKKNKTPSDTGIFYIENAGLALLNPFIPYYFKNTGLLDNHDRFIDAQAKQMAVLLLHYLIWDQAPITEDELIFNKMLCGMAIRESIDLKISLPSTALLEGENMLRAALEAWPVLKNAELEDLKSSFLRRQGKLRLNNENTHLIINRQTIDILLSKLDWPISVMSYPFMEQLIFVEW